ncbi:P-loop containing nucleoside triphosphate hydrolase protein [Rhodocollybia butyracea]|uniref:P-loop containing nucleoside triphosphate hydrolase protein n=1 Tax=Rhodocollybia butyracea TaxID=206335 RepID=A0A9P5PTT4_9AGAR|nr:P-loop containing nucleoside triphosphate hydrolase protein [Rhodocollybia butyracea]
MHYQARGYTVLPLAQSVITMRLSNIPSSVLPNRLATQLASLGILTSTELLFSSSPLEIYARLSPKSISFTCFEDFIKALGDYLVTSGQDAAESAPEAPVDFKLETFPALDKQLGGGLPSARVIEISGDRGSGKSTLLLNSVLKSLVKDKEIEALWIDTTGDFPIERAVQILEETLSSIDELGPTLERLHVSTAIDIESIHEIIRSLEAQLSESHSSRIKCVVIDSITPLLGVYLSAASSQGHAIMAGLMHSLRHLAIRYSLLVLVVNNATLMRAPPGLGRPASREPVSNPYSAFESTIRKPALGPSFTFMTDATLWLFCWPEQTDGEAQSIYIVEVFRSKFSISNAWNTFKISPTGILLSSDYLGYNREDLHA